VRLGAAVWSESQRDKEIGLQSGLADRLQFPVAGTTISQEEKPPMKISIRLRDIEWTPELRKDVERRIEFAVDRYRPQVNEVLVYLADLNGPKGGVDKLCQITANLRGRSNPVLILERATEILPAVSRAVHRLGNRIGARIRRRKGPEARRFRATVRAASY
jgi:putative sigma-54 modulation protein